MFPTLYEIAGEPLPAYFTLLVVGFALATFLGARQATLLGQDREVMIDLGLFSLIWGVIGGRVLHVLADGYFWDYVNVCIDPSKVAWHITQSQCRQAEGLWDAAANVCRPAERNCFAWAEFWKGGLAYYGGLIGGLLGGVWLLRRDRFPVLLGSDIAGAGIALGLFFGRMGCFFGGCCFGVHTDHAFGLSFPPWSPASESQWRAGELAQPSMPSLPVHPTQLYEAIGCLVIAGLAYFVIGRYKRFHGQVILSVLALYSALRFGLEFLRADDRGGVLGLSTSQIISVLIVIAIVPLYARLRRNAVTKAAAST